MLNEHRIHPVLPVYDLDRAKAFYRDVLELQFLGEVPSAAMFAAGKGSQLVLTKSTATSRAGHTQAGWAVPNLDAVMAHLRARGVVFEDYDYPHLKTVDGVATVAAGRAAWFHDTEDNVIRLIEFPS